MLEEMTARSHPRSGYTLPVFACASAIAALRHLLDPQTAIAAVSIRLIRPDETAQIPVEQVAQLPDGSVLAITRSDPGDNLDLTRDTPVWAVVNWGSPDPAKPIHLQGGAGIGWQVEKNQPAIYAYAQQLLTVNLIPLMPAGRSLHVTFILPEGRSLAQRTSNAAFGVVDGLSLLGTTGIAEPLSAPGHLEILRAELRAKAQQHNTLVFCIGENGLDRALTLGIPPERRVKTANWLGPLLVEAALDGVQGILLLGYHGKLIKLAGGIFHTHHYVADGRQEILAAIAAAEGLSTIHTQQLLQAETTEAGLTFLRQLDACHQTTWVAQIYQQLVERIDRRTTAYAHAHSDCTLTVGSLLFDRKRTILATSDRAQALMQTLLVS